MLLKGNCNIVILVCVETEMAARVHLKNDFTEDEKCHNLMSGSNKVFFFFFFFMIN